MSIHVEFNPFGESPFVLEVDLANIQTVAARFRESGTCPGKDKDGTMVFVMPGHLISYKQVPTPKIDLRRTKGSDDNGSDGEPTENKPAGKKAAAKKVAK